MKFPILIAAWLCAGVNASWAACPTAPAGIRDIKALGYYSDGAKSVVDHAQQEENVRLTKPFDDYNAEVARLSDRFVDEGDNDAGHCALAWLDRWAQDGGMLGQMVHVNNDQADYLRQWVHGGISMAYLKVRALADPAQQQRIDAWLAEIARRNLDYWADGKHTRNNHYYWTGVGVTAAAIAAHDPQLLAQARAIYRKGIDDIEDDGSLPMEMKRRARALHYHNYALDPLVLMAEMARSIGEDWYAYRDHRIDLLASRVAAGFKDPAWFAQHAGIAQESAKPDGESGWVEFYRLRTTHAADFDALHAAAPFIDRRAGGNLTLMAQHGVFDPK